jgi:archaemetzincin
MLSIEHCTAYVCNMCGAMHREESDRRPILLCPECLPKLLWACKADPVKRFQELIDFCHETDLTETATRYKASLKALQGK